MIARFRIWWNEFFMAEEVPYGMALVRITLPLVLLVGVLPRWRFVREIYSTDGAATPIWQSYGTSALLPELSAPVAIGLFSLLVFCLLSASIGWRTRTSLAIAVVLYAGFGVLDMVSTLTKYSVLASHAMFLLAFSQCGAVWSVDAWIKRRTQPTPFVGLPLSPVWPRRLLQLLLAICYLGSAFTKMHTPAYFTGDQMLYWMLANMNFENRVGEYLSMYPSITVVSAYTTIIWEMLFIALCWRSPWRWIMLSIGVVFHIMSFLMLGLIVFPLLCLALYLAFLNQADVERAVVALRTFARRMKLLAARRPSRNVWQPPTWLHGSSSLAAFGLLAACCAVFGVEIEYRLDVYQQKGPDGPLALQPADEATVTRMLGSEKTIRPQDLFFSFDVGTTTMGGLLADRRDRFQTGETAILQCNMTPPHPDMWVEVSLRDNQNRTIRRFGQVIPRETLHSNFTYLFDDSLTSGPYDFVITYDGNEITRRSFTFEESQPSQTAAATLSAVR